MKVNNLNPANTNMTLFGDNKATFGMINAVITGYDKGSFAPVCAITDNFIARLLRKYTPFCGLLCRKKDGERSRFRSSNS